MKNHARALALEFTSWASVTGTPGEAHFAGRLADRLSHFDVWQEAVPGGAEGRSNVFALKRGRGARTVMLAGHFDTVPFDDYGELAEWALRPDALAPAMIRRLRMTGESSKALADLESGDFLPGRGLLDMKCGIAAGIAAMEAYHGDANLLLVATADEEERSAGMRAAAPRLGEIARARELDIALAVNLDAISDQDDGAMGRVIAMGSIGKQLLTAYVIGQESHACYPCDGVNAAYLAAELVTEFELAPELEERTGAELAAAPTTLHAKDLKSGYNVTTPGQAWVYWNTLQHRRSAADTMDIALMLARRAMARAAKKLERDIAVMAYGDLSARAAAPHDWRDGADLPEQAKLLTAAAARASGLAGPAVILGFGSVPYPAVSMEDPALDARLAAAVAPHGIARIAYFPGISDMSFFGRAPQAGGTAHQPLAGRAFDEPVPAGLPSVNLGPWGRDYHHWLERVHAPYAFETLPRAILGVIAAAAQKD